MDIMFNGIWEEDERKISYLKHDTLTKDTPYLKYQKTNLYNPKPVLVPEPVPVPVPVPVPEPISKPESNDELDYEIITYSEVECDIEEELDDSEYNADILDKQIYSKFMYN